MGLLNLVKCAFDMYTFDKNVEKFWGWVKLTWRVMWLPRTDTLGMNLLLTCLNDYHDTVRAAMHAFTGSAVKIPVPTGHLDHHSLSNSDLNLEVVQK